MHVDQKRKIVLFLLQKRAIGFIIISSHQRWRNSPKIWHVCQNNNIKIIIIENATGGGDGLRSGLRRWIVGGRDVDVTRCTRRAISVAVASK